MTAGQWVELIGAATAALVAIAGIITAVQLLIKARAELRAVAMQLHPNGGGSLRDAVDDLARAVDRVETKTGDNGKDIRGVRRDVGRTADDVLQLRSSADAMHRDHEHRLTDHEHRIDTLERQP